MVDHTHRVLIIDAPDNNRHELYSALASKGYDLTSSASGQEALDLLRNSKFDLILLGAELPDVSSRDILVHVKSVYQATPVIIVSNDLDTATMMQSMELGADEFIHEPLNLPVILMRIKTTIQKTRSQEERMQQILHVSEHMNNIIMVPESVGLDSKQSVNIDTYLQHALTEFKQIYNADAGTIYVREGRVLRFAAVQTDSLGLAFGGTTEIPLNFQPLNLYDEHSGEPNYRNVASYVALKGETVSSPDLSAEHLFDFSAVRIFDERNHYKSVACLAVPLKNHKKEVIGVLQLINARDDQGQIIPFDPAKRLITESLCSHVAMVLSNHFLIQQMQAMTKMETDLQVGRQIQQAFLPTSFPAVPGWEIASCFRPARQVAGDFYDAFLMPSNRLGLIIADVCDKGVGAALFMSLTRSLLRAYAVQHYSVDWSSVIDPGRPADSLKASSLRPSAGMMALQGAVSQTNDYIKKNHDDLNMFATTFFGVLEPTKGSMLYINAGHCPAWIIDPQGNVKGRLEPTGPAVGLFANVEFEIKEALLAPGDSLFLFTDGIIDARDAAGQRFKEANLLSLLQQPFPPIKDFLGLVEARLVKFIGSAAQFDDITMLGVRRDF